MYLRLLPAVSFVLIITSCATAAVENLPKQDCVLDDRGNQDCQPSLTPDSLIRKSSSRPSRPAPPCSRYDTVCWCKKALQYTNGVRSRKGMKMLRLGPQMQMDNAMKYAKRLSQMGYLKHQDMRTVTKRVRCKRWMGGENLAFNYESRDIARACVNQWIGSKGHYENLVRSWFEEMVVGFHFDKDGRVYCVQTFSLVFRFGTFGRVHGPRCAAVGSA